MLTLDHRFEFEGQTVAWGTIGKGDPVVLIHGFPWSSQAWRNIAPWIAERCCVYYFDMLGCGLSDKFAGQEVSEAVQNRLLSALIGHWNLERPRVVAHDFGGLAALRGHFIDRIPYHSLHLIDAVGVLPSGSPFYRHVAQYEAAFAGLPAYAHDALFRAYTGQAVYYPMKEEAVNIYFTPWQGELGQPAFYRQIAQADTRHIEQVQERYRKCGFEVHLIWGAQDRFISTSQGRELFERLDADSFTVVENAGHLVHEDAPEAIVGRLMETL